MQPKMETVYAYMLSSRKQASTKHLCINIVMFGPCNIPGVIIKFVVMGFFNPSSGLLVKINILFHMCHGHVCLFVFFQLAEILLDRCVDSI